MSDKEIGKLTSAITEREGHRFSMQFDKGFQQYSADRMAHSTKNQSKWSGDAAEIFSCAKIIDSSSKSFPAKGDNSANGSGHVTVPETRGENYTCASIVSKPVEKSPIYTCAAIIHKPVEKPHEYACAAPLSPEKVNKMNGKNMKDVPEVFACAHKLIPEEAKKIRGQQKSEIPERPSIQLD